MSFFNSSKIARMLRTGITSEEQLLAYTALTASIPLWVYDRSAVYLIAQPQTKKLLSCVKCKSTDNAKYFAMNLNGKFLCSTCAVDLTLNVVQVDCPEHKGNEPSQPCGAKDNMSIMLLESNSKRTWNCDGTDCTNGTDTKHRGYMCTCNFDLCEVCVEKYKVTPTTEQQLADLDKVGSDRLQRQMHDPISRHLQVSYRFRALVNSEQFSDVRFQVLGKTYYGHRTVIAARSAELKQLVCGEHKHGIVMKNVTSDKTFAQFLRYIYTDRCTVTGDNVADLLLLARTYNLPGCLKKCVRFISTQCGTSTPSTLYALWVKSVDEKADFAGPNPYEMHIRLHGEKLLTGNTMGFLQLSKAMLVLLVSGAQVSVTEVQLLRAVLAWGEYNVAKQNFQVPLHTVLTGVLEHVRIHDITLADFAELISNHPDMLTEARAVATFHVLLNEAHETTVESDQEASSTSNPRWWQKASRSIVAADSMSNGDEDEDEEENNDQDRTVQRQYIWTQLGQHARGAPLPKRFTQLNSSKVLQHLAKFQDLEVLRLVAQPVMKQANLYTWSVTYTATLASPFVIGVQSKGLDHELQYGIYKAYLFPRNEDKAGLMYFQLNMRKSTLRCLWLPSSDSKMNKVGKGKGKVKTGLGSSAFGNSSSTFGSHSFGSSSGAFGSSSSTFGSGSSGSFGSSSFSGSKKGNRSIRRQREQHTHSTVVTLRLKPGVAYQPFVRVRNRQGTEFHIESCSTQKFASALNLLKLQDGKHWEKMLNFQQRSSNSVFAKPGFGQQSNGSSGFGFGLGPKTTSNSGFTFGKPFGKSTTATAPSNSGFSFGSAAPSKQTFGFGNSSTSFGFGKSSTTTAPSTSSFSFGKSKTTSAPSTSSFGFGKSKTTSATVAATPSPGFGKSSTTTAPSTSSFGFGKSSASIAPAKPAEKP